MDLLLCRQAALDQCRLFFWGQFVLQPAPRPHLGRVDSARRLGITPLRQAELMLRLRLAAGVPGLPLVQVLGGAPKPSPALTITSAHFGRDGMEAGRSPSG